MEEMEEDEELTDFARCTVIGKRPTGMPASSKTDWVRDLDEGRIVGSAR